MAITQLGKLLFHPQTDLPRNFVILRLLSSQLVPIPGQAHSRSSLYSSVFMLGPFPPSFLPGVWGGRARGAEVDIIRNIGSGRRLAFGARLHAAGA